MNKISSEEIYQVTRQVWIRMLNFDLKLMGARPFVSRGERSYACTISLNGDWRGGVALLFQAKLAEAAAAHIFEARNKPVTSEQIRDAVGEITNQIAGLVKSKLAPKSLLSPPTIAEGINLVVDIPKCQQIGVASMQSKSSGISISIWRYIPK